MSWEKKTRKKIKDGRREGRKGDEEMRGQRRKEDEEEIETR